MSRRGFSTSTTPDCTQSSRTASGTSAIRRRPARHAELSIQTSKSLYVRSLSFCRTVQATGHLLSGDIDQAATLASAVVDTAAEQVRSHRVLAYLSDFGARLAQYPDARPAREFRQYATERLGNAS